MGRPVNNNSPAITQKWASEVMLEAMDMSYFKGLTNKGGNYDSLIYRAGNMQGANNGHRVNFTAFGQFTDVPLRGDTQGTGKGEKRRTFSNWLQAQRIRKVVQTDTKFDRHQLMGGEKYLSESGIRSALVQYQSRMFDQRIFDTLQGITPRSTSPNDEFRATHAMRYPLVNSKPGFGYEQLNELEKIVSVGTGFSRGPSGVRVPLPGMKVIGRINQWLLMIDPDVKQAIKNNEGYQEVLRQADYRGEKNRLLAPMLEGLGRIMIAEMPRAFSNITHDSAIGPYAFSDADGTAVTGDKNPVEIDQVSVFSQGLRQFDGNNKWTGQASFGVGTTEIWSRALLVGMHGLQLGISGLPFVETDRAPIDGFAELSMESWWDVQKTKWESESRGDYKEASVTNIDWAVIPIDIQISA